MFRANTGHTVAIFASRSARHLAARISKCWSNKYQQECKQGCA
jgi:hypothetical protein